MLENQPKRPMSIGQLGEIKFLNRKFRWIAEIHSLDGQVILEKNFAKLSTPPHFEEEEKQCSESKDNKYHCVYTKPQKVTMSLISCENKTLLGFYKYLSTAIFEDTPKLLEKCQITLELVDGCGMPVDIFVLKDAYPMNVNFGDLDYSNSDEIDLELTFQFQEVEWEYMPKIIQNKS